MFDTLPILAVWWVSVSYKHLVVGILVGIFGTVTFDGNSVLTIWLELLFKQFGRNSSTC
jgi:hypothetical protein